MRVRQGLRDATLDAAGGGSELDAGADAGVRPPRHGLRRVAGAGGFPGDWHSGRDRRSGPWHRRVVGAAAAGVAAPRGRKAVGAAAGRYQPALTPIYSSTAIISGSPASPSRSTIE